MTLNEQQIKAIVDKIVGEIKGEGDIPVGVSNRHIHLSREHVDILFGKDGPILCEVNSNAHFKTTLECTGVNMALEIMRHIAGKLAEE